MEKKKIGAELRRRFSSGALQRLAVSGLLGMTTLPVIGSAMDHQRPSSSGLVRPDEESQSVGLQGLLDLQDHSTYALRENVVVSNYKALKSIFLNQFAHDLTLKVTLLDRYLFQLQDGCLPLLPTDRTQLRQVLAQVVRRGLVGYSRKRAADNLLNYAETGSEVLRTLQNVLFLKNKEFMKRNFVYERALGEGESALFLPRPGRAGLFYAGWARIFEQQYQEMPPLSDEFQGVLANSLRANLLKVPLQEHHRELIVQGMTVFFERANAASLASLSAAQQEAIRVGRRALKKLTTLPFEPPIVHELQEKFFQIARAAQAQDKIQRAPSQARPYATGVDPMLLLSMNTAIQEASAALPELFPTRTEHEPAQPSPTRATPSSGGGGAPTEAEVAWQDILRRLESIRDRESMRRGLVSVRGEVATLGSAVRPREPLSQFADELLEDIDRLIHSAPEADLRADFQRVLTNLRAEAGGMTLATVPEPVPLRHAFPEDELRQSLREVRPHELFEEQQHRREGELQAFPHAVPALHPDPGRRAPAP